MDPTTDQALPSFRVGPYRPDSGFELKGILTLFAALAVVGAALGWLASFVSQWFYLILLFPAAIGGALGAVGVLIVTRTRTRNPVVCALAGFLGGVFAMTVMHYASYRSFVAEVEKELDVAAFLQMVDDEAAMAEATPDERAVARDLAAALRGLPGYLDLAAKEGVSISRASDSSGGRGLNLGYTGTYIYWLVEVLIVAGIVLVMVRTQAAMPFCTRCSQWKDAEALGEISGDPGPIADAVREGDLAAWRRAADGAGPRVVRLTMHACKVCGDGSEVVVLAELVDLDKNGQVKTKSLARASYPGTAAAAIRQVVATA